MKRSDSWNRHEYPVQTNAPEPLNDRLPKPDDAPKEPLRIPRKLRAVRDAETDVKKHRTIVICLDGTGDKFDSDNSNIIHLVSCLKKDDPNQVTYYQAGIGTYSEGGLSSGFAAALDMAVGSGLGLHVRDAYHFLMHTYKEGDRICIFGFSRGAYSARCLAGMVHKVGLLPPRNVEQIQFAYEFYKDDTEKGWKDSADFKKTFCIDASIYFLGVFDSVASVGVIPRTLPLSSTPFSKTHHFRHAIALDERRAKFKVLNYQSKDWKQIEDPKTHKTSLEHTSEHDKSNGIIEPITGSNPFGSLKRGKTDHRFDDIESSPNEAYDTDVLEVWFLGAHADVGGGAVKNEERHKLSNIPLRWMIRQCFLCNTGIIFHTKTLAEFGLDLHTLYPKYQALNVPRVGPSPTLMEHYENGLPPITIRGKKLKPEPTKENPKKSKDKGEKLSAEDAHKAKNESYYHLDIHEDHNKQNNPNWVPEQVEDCFDSLSPINDQLNEVWTWWILELWPVGIKQQYSDSDEWGVYTGMNWGKYRGVTDPVPNLHWTVQHRMHNMGYKALARIGRSAHWNIVV